MRWIIGLLATAVLALAVVPLIRGDSDDVPAARSDSVAVPATPDPEKTRPEPRRPKPDPVADTITTVIIDIARGQTGEAETADMRRRLVASLAAEGLGDDASRKAAAEVALSSILKRADQARAAGQPLGDLKLRAVKALSRTFARELRSRLPGGKGKVEHGGALTALAPEPDVPSGYRKVSWGTLSGFEYSEGTPLPAPVKKLRGNKVGISGYMIVLAEKGGSVSEFLLVQSLWDCCFGLPPELHQGIVVQNRNSGLEFTTRAVQVLGKLEVGEDLDESGTVLSVYRLTADSTRVLD